MGRQLIDIVRDDGVDHLKEYFAPGATTGQWFETFNGGGDRDETRDRITLDDFYAVSALSVQVPFAIGRQILEEQLGADLSAHLLWIPTDVELGTAGAEHLVADGGHADQAWHLLNQSKKTGIGYVIAGKLLARKRPKLIPVYDSIVSCQFNAPDHVWLKLHARLIENGGALRCELARARATAGVEKQVSNLRALDVILWRRHIGTHRRKSCLERDSVELGELPPD